MTTTPLEIFGTPLSAGPTLIYAHSDHDTATVIDRKAVSGDPRERALCRALLLHALALLDSSELTTGLTARAAR